MHLRPVTISAMKKSPMMRLIELWSRYNNNIVLDSLQQERFGLTTGKETIGTSAYGSYNQKQRFPPCLLLPENKPHEMMVHTTTSYLIDIGDGLEYHAWC